MHRFPALLLAGLIAAGTALAQPAPDDWPAAAAEDVETVDALVAAVYDVISGPAGQARDWDRFRSLFHPEARLIPLVNSPQGTFPLYMTVDGYIERSGAYLEANGFFEVEVERVQEEYGRLVHLFSTYDSFRTAEDTEPFARGINSFQLNHDGSRWWVTNISWQSEEPDLPIPPKYDRQ